VLRRICQRIVASSSVQRYVHRNSQIHRRLHVARARSHAGKRHDDDVNVALSHSRVQALYLAASRPHDCIGHVAGEPAPALAQHPHRHDECLRRYAQEPRIVGGQHAGNLGAVPLLLQVPSVARVARVVVVRVAAVAIHGHARIRDEIKSLQDAHLERRERALRDARVENRHRRMLPVRSLALPHIPHIEHMQVPLHISTVGSPSLSLFVHGHIHVLVRALRVLYGHGRCGIHSLRIRKSLHISFLVVALILLLLLLLEEEALPFPMQVGRCKHFPNTHDSNLLVCLHVHNVHAHLSPDPRIQKLE
jgi:hypothetical protein